MSETYLVTGAAGFIGSNLVGSLLRKGIRVRGVDNFSTGRRENLEELFGHPLFEFVEADLTNKDIAETSMRDIDIVLHQAAVPSVQRSVEDPMRSHHANITATLNLLLAARDAEVKKFVYASSSSIYGDNPDLPKREDFPVRPISPYALTKYAGERYAQIFWNIYGLPTVCLRYFNVFGPKQDPFSHYSAVIPRFITAVLNQEAPVIYGDGEQSRDFTFVENVVQANLQSAAATEGFGQVYNIACGERTSLNQLIALVQDIVGVTVEVERKEGRKGDVPHSLADISKAWHVLGYVPKIKIREGLEKTVAWLRDHASKK